MNGMIYVILTLTIINSILIIIIFFVLLSYIREITERINELTSEIKGLLKELKPSLKKSMKNIESTTNNIKNLSNIISSVSPLLLFSGSSSMGKIGKYISLFYGIRKGIDIFLSLTKKGGKNEWKKW